MTKKSFRPIGSKFGRLTVIDELDRYIAPNGISLRVWECWCSCGNKTKKFTSQLSDTRFEQSCGCGGAETRKTHGFAGRHVRTSEYVAWKAMRRRCSVKDGHPDFQYYAARGIKVCDRWKDFTLFLLDMGAKPTPQHSLDRIDCDGNYEPSNCRWATATEQSRNRRSMGGRRAA